MNVDHQCFLLSKGLTGNFSMTEYTGLPGRHCIAMKRGSYMVCEINMGVCPRLEFDNIMFINCLRYDFYIYGAFEFLYNYIANL